MDFKSWLEQFDRQILNDLTTKITSPGWSKYQLSSDEIAQVQQVLSMAKERLMKEINGPLRPIWNLYLNWEKKHSSKLMGSPQGNLSPAIKDGGNSPLQIPTPQQEAAGNFEIIVPTNLYNVLYWRNIVKMLEHELNSGQPLNMRYLFPKLAKFFKS